MSKQKVKDLTVPGFERRDYLMVAQIQVAYHDRFPVCEPGDFVVGLLDGVNKSLRQAGFIPATLDEIFPPSPSHVQFAANIPAPTKWTTYVPKKVS